MSGRSLAGAASPVSGVGGATSEVVAARSRCGDLAASETCTAASPCPASAARTDMVCESQPATPRPSPTDAGTTMLRAVLRRNCSMRSRISFSFMVQILYRLLGTSEQVFARRNRVRDLRGTSARYGAAAPRCVRFALRRRTASRDHGPGPAHRRYAEVMNCAQSERISCSTAHAPTFGGEGGNGNGEVPR